MDSIKVKRQQSLTEILKTAPNGVWVEIKNADYKPSVVRVMVSQFRKKGLRFEATEVGCIDSIKVKRLV